MMLNLRLLVMVILAILAVAGAGLLRLDIDTDVIHTLPADKRIIGDALQIFSHHPIHDQIAIDIMLDPDDPDTLVECGALVEEQLRASGLFSVVGTGKISGLMPELTGHVTANLPLLFSERELEEFVAPRLEEEAVRQRLAETAAGLGGLEGIGQAKLIGQDPLHLRDLVLSRLALLAPSAQAWFYRGSLISADGRHLLVTAKPATSGSDTASARQISLLLTRTAETLRRTYGERGVKIEITPVGAYRAALDNERIIRHDVNRALLLATGGIALLLLFSFHRPLIGLLAMVPALAGTAAALLVYSLLHLSISIMILGFGGAIISITVDHGIAYLLFLDRSRETSGREATREVFAVGVMAVLTTIGAFLVLGFSGFPVFAQLGQFTALGIFFSFLFVHTVFPRIFPAMPAARPRQLPLRKLADMLFCAGIPGAAGAALLALVLLFYARPTFHVSLSSMNTVSRETMAADASFTEVWGGIGERTYLMTTADSLPELQHNSDRLLEQISRDIDTGRIAEAFVPSQIFPGRERAEMNLAAWQQFWNGERIKQVSDNLNRSGAALGFTPRAFSPFLSMLGPNRPPVTFPEMPAEVGELLGITTNKDNGQLVQFITVVPGEHYDAADFFNRYHQWAHIFDAGFFSQELAKILFATFTTMLLIIAACTVLFLFVFFASWQLTLLTLLPVIFAYICTMGTLRLIGHPLDIPALMLSIVIFGMGIDYSLFTVRAFQRYGRISHPSFALVRTSVFMAGASTLIGFGVLCLADHAMLRSIGLTSFFGIASSLLGTFLLLPPLLGWYFTGTKSIPTREQNINERVRRRYRLLETYPRMFARFKLRFDPLFTDLPRMLAQVTEVQWIVDIGCGYGVPACWCLEYFPRSELVGIDPDPERVRVAARAVGERGIVVRGEAPELPTPTPDADVVLLLDILHYLDDATVRTLLKNCAKTLRPGGIIVSRFVIRPAGRCSIYWRIEDYLVRRSGAVPHYRTGDALARLMREEGLAPLANEISPANPELAWAVGTRPRTGNDD